MLVSVVIPVHNKWELTSSCLRSLAKTTTLDDVEVIVVDNGSTDETHLACGELGKTLFGSRFRYLRSEINLNFSAGCNNGAESSKGNFLFFLNNDTVLMEGWLEPLLKRLGMPPYPCAVGPMLVYPEFAGKRDRVQHLGVAFEPEFYATHLYEGFPVDHPVCKKIRLFRTITGAALLIERNAFFAAGKFDEDFINGGEDIQLCLELVSKGEKIICDTASKIYHLASQTPGIHAHAAHNTAMLKNKSLHKIYPDLHLFAKNDGYELALDRNLKVYLDLPERRKAVFKRQIDRACCMEDLEDLILREPLCYDAYTKLAALYVDAGEMKNACNTLLLSLKFRKDLYTANKLIELINGMEHVDEETEKMKSIADATCCGYAENSIERARKKAVEMASFMKRIKNDELYMLYSTWLLNTTA